MRRVSYVCLFALFAAPALAAADDDFSLPDEQVTRVDTDTGDIFGFTEGTDTQEQGEREVSFDAISRFNKRRFGAVPLTNGMSVLPPDADDDASGDGAGIRPLGRPVYRAVNAKLGFQYGLTDDFSIEFGAFGDARRIRNVPDLADKAASAFDGLSVEFKYRLIERTRDNPFGLAVTVAPRWARVADVEGTGQNAFSTEATLLFDARLVPDRLWFATNIGFEPAYARVRGTGRSERDSTFSWSGALTARVLETTFVGGEVRYLRAYEGAFLNRLEGGALFVGPTLHHRFTKQAYLTLAWSAQVAGRDRDPAYAGRALDLTHFERHVLRAKVGIEF